MSTSTIKLIKHNTLNETLETAKTLTETLPQDFLFTTVLPTIKGLVEDEIRNQYTPLRETQNVLINETASIQVEMNDIKENLKNTISVYFENVHLKKRLSNLTKILSFKNLLPGWNGEGTEGISEKLTNIALDFINLPILKYQPSVFPTGRASIQFEYQKSSGDYLEIEIFEDHITLFSEIDDVVTEKEYLTIHEILGDINAFHARR